MMGLSNDDRFYMGDLNLEISLFVLHLIDNIDLTFSMLLLGVLLCGMVLFFGIIQVHMDVFVFVVNAWFGKW